MACDHGCRKNKITRDQRQALIDEAKRCENCQEDDELEIDHQIPVSRGGCHCLDNLWVLCRRCNRHKWTMTHLEFEDSGLAKWLRKQAHNRWLAWIEEQQRNDEERLRQRKRQEAVNTAMDELNQLGNSTGTAIEHMLRRAILRLAPNVIEGLYRESGLRSELIRAAVHAGMEQEAARAVIREEFAQLGLIQSKEN